MRINMCSIRLVGTFQWCYIFMKTTKHASVTEQTWKDGFHLNWPTDDERRVVKRDQWRHFRLWSVAHVYYMWQWKNNRFLHTLLGKTGWSSTSDRNFDVFSRVECSKTSEKKQQFLSRVEDTISSVNQQLSLSRTPRDPRHWSVTNLHKLSDQYHKIERYEIHIT